ncbi:NfeD family protein [Vibrio hepatarius]|uniref:NfeD family protein n=1 Tax=Vibrio hepatarius TaxID=171383 RepID=UPI001C0999FE|nr:NfeD family protein [Vibrio hepatarius]MBU2899387.1 hypothetical protein [Vibrio hepatarius]
MSELFSSSGNIMMLIGAVLIGIEMLTGCATALFLLVLGLIFSVTGVVIEFTGISSFPMIVAFIASLATAAFFFLKIWGKNNRKSNENLDGNVYEGETFVADKAIPSGGTAEVNVFGISWQCSIENSQAQIEAGDEVVIVKADVGRLIVRKSS